MNSDVDQPPGNVPSLPFLFGLPRLARPTSVLQLLTPSLRWEVTRRHPIYLYFWNIALRFHEEGPQSENDLTAGRLAVMYLSTIGAASKDALINPSLPYQEPHQGRDESPWADGAVEAVSLRGMLGILMRNLSSEEKRAAAELLCNSAKLEEDDPNHIDLYLSLGEKPFNTFDRIPNLPMVGVNLQAPKEAIQKSLSILIDQLKVQEEIPDRRRRVDKVEQYLKVWDLYEGWSEGAYDSSRAKTLKQIASELKSPLSSVCSQYEIAFKLITGHPYQIVDWWTLFRPVKHASALIAIYGRRRKGRAKRSTSIRAVTETTLTGGKEFSDGGTLANIPASSGSTTTKEDKECLEDLLDSGLTDAQIVARLKLKETPDILNCLRDYRKHRDDIE